MKPMKQKTFPIQIPGGSGSKKISDCAWPGGSGQRLGSFSSCFDSQVTVRSQSGHSQVNGQVTVRSRVLRVYYDFQ